MNIFKYINRQFIMDYGQLYQSLLKDDYINGYYVYFVDTYIIKNNEFKSILKLITKDFDKKIVAFDITHRIDEVFDYHSSLILLSYKI